jgi:hypothetical protein
LAKRGQKDSAVLIVAKDVLTAVPAIDHMIDRPAIFHAQFARHGAKFSAAPSPVKRKVQIVRTDTCIQTLRRTGAQPTLRRLHRHHAHCQGMTAKRLEKPGKGRKKSKINGLRGGFREFGKGLDLASAKPKRDDSENPK